MILLLIKKEYQPQRAKKSSTVEAGDSMVGGMTWILEQNASVKEIVGFIKNKKYKPFNI